MGLEKPRVISYALSNPIVGGLGGLAILLNEETAFSNFPLYTLLILFFYSILPFVSVYYLKLRGKTDIFMSDRSRRPKHFLPGLTGYAISAYIFQSWSARLMTMTSTAFLATSLILLFLTLMIKVSIHIAGLVSTTILLIYSYGPLGLILLPIIPVLAWARVSTGEHTYMQTVLGILVGLAGSSLSIILMQPVFISGLLNY